MQSAGRAAQARRELDRKFSEASLEPVRHAPRKGWVRAIRDALGLSQAALGARLGITAQAVVQLEAAEAQGRITMAKLADLARALDCDLVYALVPRQPLEKSVMDRARRLAAEDLGYVNATMALEDQALDRDRIAEQIEARAQEIVHQHRLWGAA